MFHGACIALLVLAKSAQAEDPKLTIGDLVGDKTIDSLSISPNGEEIAYRILSSSIALNEVNATWKRRDLALSTTSVTLGRSYRPSYVPLFTLPKDGVSAWSPDGQTLYVLAEDAAGVQIHRLGPGSEDVPVTHDPADVIDFAIEPDGRLIRYHVGNARASIKAKLKLEEEQGIRLDRTVITDGLRLTNNFRIGPRATTIRRLAEGDLAGEPYAGTPRAAEVALSPQEHDRTAAVRAAPETAILMPADAIKRGATLKASLRGGGVTVGVESARDAGLESLGARYLHYDVVVHRADGSISRCRAAACPKDDDNLREVMINERSSEVVMLVEKGESALTRIIGWNPDSGYARTIYSAGTSLDGGSRYSGAPCPRAGDYLICVEAGAALPERVVRINIDSGEIRVVDDPNAGLRAKSFGRVQTLQWNDTKGRPSDGVLVLPRQPITKPVPLVITTYRCRGFLRGGTAWLAPEHLLAQEGMAALCVNTNYAGWDDRDARGDLIPLAAHKAYLDALSAIIYKLAKQGLIDRNRVGIAGHSFSSMVIAYAVSHSSLFRAAVIGGAFDIDPSGYTLTAPTADSWRKKNFAIMGLPKPTQDPTRIWKTISPSAQASRTSAAFLMQLPESEYASCLQFYAALQDAGIPSDMFIYPGEGHMVGLQPSHQYWRNLRSIDWFEFWLTGRENRTPATDAQYDHWEALRAADHRMTVPGELEDFVTPLAHQAATQASTSTKERIRE